MPRPAGGSTTATSSKASAPSAAGTVTLIAGGNISNVDAVVPTNAANAAQGSDPHHHARRRCHSRCWNSAAETSPSGRKQHRRRCLLRRTRPGDLTAGGSIVTNATRSVPPPSSNRRGSRHHVHPASDHPFRRRGHASTSPPAATSCSARWPIRSCSPKAWAISLVQIVFLHLRIAVCGDGLVAGRHGHPADGGHTVPAKRWRRRPPPLSVGGQ